MKTRTLRQSLAIATFAGLGYLFAGTAMSAAAPLATLTPSMLSMSAAAKCPDTRCPMEPETGCPDQTGTWCSPKVNYNEETGTYYTTCDTVLCPPTHNSDTGF